MNMRVDGSWFRDRLYDELESSIRYGIHRAYKHREDSLPEDAEEALIEQILLAVTNQLDEAIRWGEDNE